ncbi:hypothetical protein HAX54_005510, partial [Datura stramonium]|nr:hypothetical protein [Datura stramonium]
RYTLLQQDGQTPWTRFYDVGRWRLAVETNNLKDWKLVPSVCENYVGHYMLGKQYRRDCEFVAKEAIAAIPYNSAKFHEWISEAKAPAIPSILGVYKTLLSLGIKPIFLTGTREIFRQIRIENLKKLVILTGNSHTKPFGILNCRPVNYSGSAVEFKSSKRTELVKAGYRIVGNMGDQWTDLIGENPGSRTFKVPDPMYYVG